MKSERATPPRIPPSSPASSAEPKPAPFSTVQLIAGIGSLFLDACAKDPEIARAGARLLRSLAGVPEPAPETKK